jgi:predicted nucleic acid-binding Zn ribbon protein
LALHEAIKGLTGDLGITRKLREFSIVTSWEEIVGAQIGKVTKPQRVEKGVLFVAVKSAPWRAELSLRRREIVHKVNEKVGAKVLVDIQFR